MNIQSFGQTSPLSRTTPLRSHKAVQATAAEPQESVQLSGAPLEKADTGKLAAQSKGLTGKVLAGLGLGLIALSLVGCGGGNTPTPPAPAPGQEQAKPQSTVASYTARMDQLKGQSDQTGFHQMAEAGYQRAMLERFAKISDPAAKSVQEIAQKGVDAFDFKADPAAQQKLMRDVMTAISQIKSEAPEVVRYTQAAQTSLTIGQAFSENASKAPGGIVGQLKSSAYDQGLRAALVKLKAAPDQLKESSGYDPALIRNYVESLAMGPEVALEFAPQLNDTGLSTVLYEQTGTVLYQQAQGQSAILGSQVTAALQFLHTLTGK